MALPGLPSQRRCAGSRSCQSCPVTQDSPALGWILLALQPRCCRPFLQLRFPGCSHEIFPSSKQTFLRSCLSPAFCSASRCGFPSSHQNRRMLRSRHPADDAAGRLPPVCPFLNPTSLCGHRSLCSSAVGMKEKKEHGASCSEPRVSAEGSGRCSERSEAGSRERGSGEETAAEEGPSGAALVGRRGRADSDLTSLGR